MPIMLKDACRRSLNAHGTDYDYFSLSALAEQCPNLLRLPFSLKVLLENLLRNQDNHSVTEDDIIRLANRTQDGGGEHEVAYRPARVLMQDFTGVPAVVDLAAMRDAMLQLGGEPSRINPLVPVDLVIDHSVMVDHFASPDSFQKNTALEMARNRERYAFLRWGSKAFDNFRVVPPGTGICHQVNVEYLAQTVWTAAEGGRTLAYPDTCVGTDSHTTMVGGMAVLGWGVGGIEAEAAMLGQPISMLVPDVIGVELTGTLPEGATATDLVLKITEMLRAFGVVGKFVEFFGTGLDSLSLADRATIANMAPEYGATCGFFPIDAEVLNYLCLTARDSGRIALVEAYAKAQGMWRDSTTEAPHFTHTLPLDLGSIVPALAGPKRPQDRVPLAESVSGFYAMLKSEGRDTPKSAPVAGENYQLTEGDIAIAAITSCTNTSNPSVLIAAGLVAQAAHRRGMQVKPWVKTSLAPGSQVVTDYLNAAGLTESLDALGFHLVGYGCTTCIGNSGPLNEAIDDAIHDNDLIVASVLSGNRNFEGRVSPSVRANYLASPPLVVAYALAGSMLIDITTEPVGVDSDGTPVMLADIWPSNEAIRQVMASVLSPDSFKHRYGNVFDGTKEWQMIDAEPSQTYEWEDGSTYVRNPPYFKGMTMAVDDGRVADITGARILAKLGDSITTDHISPAGSINRDGAAAEYLMTHQIRPVDFNSYGARRGNHEVMMRGTFGNIRLANELAGGVKGSVTRHYPSGEQMSIFDAAKRYEAENVPLVVIGGKEYGTGSSRDWAAKGTALLGIKAVVAESFERIHRSNLIGMGVLPLQFATGVSRDSLGLDGSEQVDIRGIAEVSSGGSGASEAGSTAANDAGGGADSGAGGASGGVDEAGGVGGVGGSAGLVGAEFMLKIRRGDGSVVETPVTCRIDTAGEADYFRHGGILPFVLRNLAA